jgi:thiol-disulfide isomerase/thioredoxin
MANSQKSESSNSEASKSGKQSWSRWIDRIFLLVVIVLVATGYWRNVQMALIGALTGGPKVEESSFASLEEVDWNWQLRDLEGNFIKLADLRGEPLLVNLWATWCPPCRAELPSIEKLHRNYGEKVKFLLVSGESSETLINWTEDKGYQLPFYRTATGSPEVLSSTSIPATFVIDREGNIRIDHKGAANWNSGKVRNLLDELIAE